MRALRVPREAWSRAVGLVRERLEADGVPVPGEPPTVDGRRSGADAALRDLGLLTEHGLDPSWAAAIGQHLVAPVRATLRATSGAVGATTRLTLVDDRVLLVHDAVRGAEEAHELEVTEVSAHVDVVLVRVDDLWRAVAAFLPPLEQLTAGARPSRAHGTATTTLDHVETQRLHARDVTGLPPAARAVVQDEEATLAVVVEAWPTPAAPRVVWSRWWSVAGGRLLDVQLRDDGVRLAEREPGAVAAELRWALVGAIDATTPTPSAAVGAEGAR